jgi:hypothetical protein
VHTLRTYYSIIRLYCLQPIVLGIILTQRYVNVVVSSVDLRQIRLVRLGELFLSYLGALKDITSTYNRMAHRTFQDSSLELVDMEILFKFQIAQISATMNNLDRLAHDGCGDRQEIKKRAQS